MGVLPISKSHEIITTFSEGLEKYQWVVHFSGFFIFAAALLTNKLLDLVLGDIYSSMLLLVSIFVVNL